jgi:WD40 repeat protein
MRTLGFLTCLWLAGAVALGAGPPASESTGAEKSTGHENVRRLEHQMAPLPDEPAIRFTKLFTIEKLHDGQGFRLLAFSPDGTILGASRRGGYRSHDVTLWDVQKRKLLHVLPHTDDIEHSIGAIAFVPPGDRLVTGCHNLNRVFLWDAHTGKLLDTLDTGSRPTHGITGLAPFPDGKRVMVCVTTGLTVWDLDTKAHTTLPMDEHVPRAPGNYPAAPRCCFRVAFTADGTRFATTVNHSFFLPRILLWDARTCRVTGTIPMVQGNWHLAYAPDGRTVAADYYEPNHHQKTQGRYLGVWDAATGKKVFAGEVYNYGLYDLAYTRDSKYLLAVGQHDDAEAPGKRGGHVALGVWDVATGKIVNTLEQVGVPPMSVAVSPDNKLLAVPYWGNIDIYAVEYAEQSKATPNAPRGPGQ